MLLISALACLNSANLGYEVGSIGGAALLIRDEYGWNDVQTEWFIASANMVAVLGGLVTPFIADGAQLLNFSAHRRVQTFFSVS